MLFATSGFNLDYKFRFCYRNAFELQALQDSLAEVKSGLRPENAPKFQNAVEVHMQHIQSGLSQMGNLHAFMLPQKEGPAFSVKLEQKF